MKVLISIEDDINDFISYTINKNISIYDIKYVDNKIICFINNSDLNKVNKYFKIRVLKDYSYKNILLLIKNNIIKIILLFMSLLFFYILSNTIVDINIESNNNELVNKINKSLDNYGIKRISWFKNYIELNNIKDKLLNEYKDRVEWLEIKRIGMTYNISLEERISKSYEVNEGICDVIANSDGTISKILSSSGVVLTKLNKNVKQGDLLISGDIKLNDIDKLSICAKGDVYAYKWYTMTIELPKTYISKEYTKKYKYNLLIENNNVDYKIFKSRYKNYDTDKKEIISLFGRKLYLLKEYEYKNFEYSYEEDTLDTRIDELIKEKLELNLSKNEKIISKNVLKKEENDSKIVIELFIIIERLISTQIIR